MNILTLLKHTIKKDTNKIGLITHYNCRSPYFHKILHDQERLLLLMRKEAIKPEDILVTHSRSTSLRDILIQDNLEPPHLPKGCQPCWKPRCKTCQHVSPCTHMDNRNTYTQLGPDTIVNQKTLFIY